MYLLYLLQGLRRALESITGLPIDLVLICVHEEAQGLILDRDVVCLNLCMFETRGLLNLAASLVQTVIHELRHVAVLGDRIRVLRLANILAPTALLHVFAVLDIVIRHLVMNLLEICNVEGVLEKRQQTRFRLKLPRVVVIKLVEGLRQHDIESLQEFYIYLLHAMSPILVRFAQIARRTRSVQLWLLLFLLKYLKKTLTLRKYVCTLLNRDLLMKGGIDTIRFR